MKKLFLYGFVSLCLFVLLGCSPGSPDEKDTFTLKGSAVQVSDEEYNALTPIQQYQVANKIMGTFFKGVPAIEFFDVESITGDINTLRVSPENTDFITKVRQKLKTPLENKNQVYKLVEGDTGEDNGKYLFDTTRKSLQFPMAYMFELQFSEVFFSRWMAYKLANTILFSPAEEIDSADEQDVQTIYENLSTAILAGSSIRSIILQHEKSEGNWRRFRSPEDNTREMIEIYLGLFDRDEDVPKASVACQNWYLTDEDAGYQLQKTANTNTEPQSILDGYFVTSCEDFFEAVSNHPLVIPRMTSVLVDHMLGVDYDALKRADLVRDVAASNPVTFNDIFLAIIFSKEYLLNMERAMWFEEVFFNVADKVYWRPYSNFFRDLARPSTQSPSGAINTSMAVMYQPAFSLKLGRFASVPQDVLGASYTHRGIRSALIQRMDGDPLTDWGWGPEFVDDTRFLTLENYIKYIFIAVIAREPTQAELDTLVAVINTATSNGGNSIDLTSSSRIGNRTTVILDYLSRLPELYHFNAVN